MFMIIGVGIALIIEVGMEVTGDGTAGMEIVGDGTTGTEMAGDIITGMEDITDHIGAMVTTVDITEMVGTTDTMVMDMDTMVTEEM